MVCVDTTIGICAQSRFVSMVVTSVLLYMSNRCAPHETISGPRPLLFRTEHIYVEIFPWGSEFLP